MSYGADPTGAADSTSAFQSAATAATSGNGTMVVPAGTYKISSPIEVGSSLEMDDSTVVKATASMAAVFRVGSSAFVYDEHYSGGLIEANNLAQEGIIFRQYQHISVIGMQVNNALMTGFHFGDSTLSTTSYEAVVQGAYTKRTSGSLQPGSTGVFIDSNATDNSLSQCILVSSDMGIKVMTGGNFFTDIHVWSTPTAGWMTVGFDDQGTGNFWKGCEADTVQTYGIHARKYNTIVQGCRFYNNSTYGVDNSFIGIYFDQTSPGATVQSSVFYGADSSHRLAADMAGATSTVATAGNQCVNVATLSTATTSASGSLAVTGTVTSSGNVYANGFSSLAAAATASANTVTALSLGANYYSGSTSTAYSWNLAPSQSSSGTPTATDLTLFTKGTLPSGVNPRFIFSANPASTSTPIPSVQQVYQGSYLNSSSAAAYDSWGIQDVLGSGTTPTSTLSFSHWGSSGTSAVSVPTLILNGDAMTYTPRLTWSSFGTCSTATLNCQESNKWTPTKGITIDQWTFTLMTVPSGCSWYPTVSLMQGSTTLGSIKLASGTTNYSYGSMSIPVSSSSGALYLSITSAATGCTTYASGIASSLEYIMQ